MDKIISELKRTDSNIPYVEVENNGHKFNLIVDTGCTISCIDENILDFLRYTDNGETTEGVIFANGDSTDATKLVDINLTLNNKLFTESFNIVDFYKMSKQVRDNFGITVRGLLGSEFLYKNKLILDFEESIIKHKDNNQLLLDF